MNRALVVGISGFVGSHLARYLVDNGWSVLGFDQQPLTGFDVQTGDLLDRTIVEQVILEARPEFIFLLAGVLKADYPGQFYTAHVLGTVTLLDAVLKSDLRPTVIVASSSAVYGAGLGKKAITENFRPRPVTHYAVSKLAQEMVALRYWTAFRLPVIRVRTFNLLGPGLSPVMACSDFARQIAQAEKQGRASTISTGDLSARRDFVDVRDAARAYALLAEKGRAGQVYNVASGRPVVIRGCLDFLREQARVPVEVVMDPARVQKNDVPIQIGSAKQLYDVTGWEIKISVEQSLLDMLEDWRRKVV
ncbi:MAG: NAD-dependent epimerase/dehydratase family protein [Chloroflexota bacterium]